MTFNLDFSKANQGGKIKDGKYEVIVKSVQEQATKGGAEYIEIVLVVRNDVEQAYKNKNIFHKIWKKKDTGKYNEGMIMATAEALNLEDGKTYGSIDEFFQDMVGKVALADIKVEVSGGYENENVKRLSKTQTKGIVNHQWKEKTNGNDAPPFNSTAQIDISDDDLPF